MLKYVHMLSKTFSRKIGPYVILVIGIALFSLMTIAGIHSNNKAGAAYVTSLNTFVKFVPFVFGTLFIALVALHVFKQGELDGTELMIVAKPITRKQILLGKFITTIGMIFLYQLISFIVFFIVSTMDKEATGSERLAFAASLAVGGFIVGMITMSIIVMLSSVLGKVGTMAISILFAAMVPIVSFILAPLGGGVVSDSISDKKTVFMTGEKMEDESAISNSHAIYEAVGKDDYDDTQANVWYGTASWVDVWYQWSRFYSMFSNSDHDSLVKKTVLKDLDDSKYQTININNDTYLATINYSKYGQTASEIKARINKSIGAGKQYYSAKGSTIDTDWAGINYDDRLTDLNNYASSDIDSDLAYAGVMKAAKDAGNTSINDARTANADWIPSSLMKISDGSLHKIVKKDFIHTGVVVVIWLIIAMGLLSGSVALYAKRDFK